MRQGKKDANNGISRPHWAFLMDIASYTPVSNPFSMAFNDSNKTIHSKLFRHREQMNFNDLNTPKHSDSNICGQRISTIPIKTHDALNSDITTKKEKPNLPDSNPKNSAD